ncbi:putative membrane protein insertion efficiency factor [Clostridium sp. CAG:557]|nr:putative membrane protein insertion efficiency factor [Clostridium sp. CAG:557]
MMKKFFIRIIKFYQRNISINKPPRCRFYPTCSEYGLQAIEQHGLIKGLLLTGCRILRCNPLFKGGYDPVPERKKK